MIDKSFIEKIVELSGIQTIEQDGTGRLLTNKTVYPVKEAEVAPLSFHTLDGLVALYRDLSADRQKASFFHVREYDEVDLLSDIFGPEKQRDTYACARPYEVHHYFNSAQPLEHFIIYLQAAFVQDESTAKLLKIVGNLRSEVSATYADDGITQQVSAKTGITRIENVDLPNPVVLRPYRTFPALRQPESRFVFRLKQDGDKVMVSLHEGDGGAWRDQAIREIVDYLRAILPDARIIA